MRFSRCVGIHWSCPNARPQTQRWTPPLEGQSWRHGCRSALFGPLRLWKLHEQVKNYFSCFVRSDFIQPVAHLLMFICSIQQRAVISQQEWCFQRGGRQGTDLSRVSRQTGSGSETSTWPHRSDQSGNAGDRCGRNHPHPLGSLRQRQREPRIWPAGGRILGRFCISWTSQLQ